MAGHGPNGRMDHQDSTICDSPVLTQNSRPQQLGASPDLGQELDDSKSFEKQWAGKNHRSSRPAGQEELTTLNWIAFLRQTIQGQIEAKKEELRVMLHENPPHPWMDHQGSTNYDTPNLKQNFKQWPGANIESPPHPGPSTTKSPTWWSMQPWCGYDEMARHLYGGMDHQGLTTYNTPDDDGEHEQQEVDESRSSNFDKRWAGANIENPPYPGPLMAPEKWAASFCQKELNDGQGISNSDSRSRARDPNELNDSQSFKKQWPRMNLQIPPHSWPSQFSMGIQNYEAFGLSPPIWTPKGLGKTTSSDAPMRARPPEQFAGTSLHIPCIWTLTISDPWWYLYGLYQGEPPPKNRRLFRPNGKRTRIKEDLQGQLSLHGGNVGPPVSVERFCEEISMKLRSSSIFSSIFMITELSKLGPNQS
jgi:hypothetical protein